MKKKIQKEKGKKVKTCIRVLFLIKFQADACNYIKKETLAQVIFCGFCKIFKKTFFYRTPTVAASQNS